MDDCEQMVLSGIKVPNGSWLVANFADFPSEQNCQVVIMRPAAQKEDLVLAAVAHAINSYGHQKAPELRQGIEGLLRPVEV